MNNFDRNKSEKPTGKKPIEVNYNEETRRFEGEKLFEKPQPRRRRSDRYKAPDSSDSSSATFVSSNEEQKTIVSPLIKERELRKEEGEPRLPMSHSQVQRKLFGQGKPGGGVNSLGNEESSHEGRPVAKRRVQPTPEYLKKEEPLRPNKKKRNFLSMAVLGLLVIGFFIVGFALLPQRDTGFLGALNKVKTQITSSVSSLLGKKVVEPLEVKRFTASSNTGQAPMEIVFSITTSNSVENIRLVTNENMLIEEKASMVNNESGKIWSLKVPFFQAFSGSLKVHVFDGEYWYDSGNETIIQVNAPAIQAWNKEGAVVVNSPSPDQTDEPEDFQGGEAPLEEPENSLTNKEDENDGNGEAIGAMVGEDDDQGVVAFTDLEEQEKIAEPTLEPTIEPEPTPLPQPTNTPMPYMLAGAVEGTNPTQIGLNTKIYEGNKSVASYARTKEVQMKSPEEYGKFDNGVLTFRGGPFRQNASFGFVEVENEKMDIAWTVPVGSLDSYSGIYWTGQPAIVKWPKQIREMMKIKEEKVDKTGLTEVILGAQDGKIYFIDLEDGELTRDPIEVGYPLRSSISVHPNSYPLLSVGQGISKLKKGTGKIGYRLYNLIDHKELMLVNGRDDQAFGSNGAMKGTPVIDRESDTMIFAGENGLLYTINLNTKVISKKLNNEEETQEGTEESTTVATTDEGKLTIEPETVKYRFKAKGQKDGDTSVEGSVAVYGSYVYFADGLGVLQCVNVNTMEPVWAIKTDDNTDATIALDFDEDGSLGLYTINMLHKQGKKGVSTIRRLDAMTGQQVWSTPVEVKYDTKDNGGGKASPLIGKGSIDNMVIFTVAKTTETDGKGGTVLALDKKTGSKLWSTNFDSYSWSSPVAIYNEEGKAWIVQGNQDGQLHLLEGETGNLLSSLTLEGEIMASPAVYNNTLVIGTTGKDTSYIYGIEIQ